MPITPTQLQNATHYIVERCRYRTERFGTTKLTQTEKKDLYRTLIFYLEKLKKNKSITINPYQKELKEFTQYLGKNDILFPKRTTLYLYQNGQTYKNKKLIYDYRTVKTKANAKLVSIKRQSSSFNSDSSSIRSGSSDSILETIRRISSDVVSLTYKFTSLTTQSKVTQLPDEQEAKDVQALKVKV